MNRWWLKLARYALPQARSLVLILILMLVGTAFGLLGPWPLKLIVDYVLPGKQLPSAVAWIEILPGAASASGQLAWLAAATVALFLTRRVVSILQEYLQAGAGSRMVYDLAGDLFSHLQGRSLLFHNKQRTGDIVRRVTADTVCVRELVLNVYLPLLKSAVTVLSMFFIMWQLSRLLAVFAIGLAVPLCVLARIFARPMSERRYQEWEVQGEIASLAEQTLTAIPIVQAFGREELEDRRFRHLAGKTVQATLRSELAQHQFRVSTAAVNAVAKAVVMTAGGISVVQGNLSVGDLLVLISYFLTLYSPIETLAYLSEGFASAAAGARRVLGVLESNEPKVVDRPGAIQLLEEAAGAGIHVQLHGVTFGYDPDRPVLQGVDLELRPGETVALVGPTGAGKTTLVGLILRFFDLWRGSIYFNNSDIREVQVASLRSQIALVPQEPFLLPLTIAENIAYARPSASREEIIAAAVAANAEEFIAKLPRGYDTVVGERGVTLSGGEKQRLSIARAFLKRAPVLILDEPTSALDTGTEVAVLQALGRLMAGRTTLIIAHRLSTIRGADRIVVLHKGQVAEEGKHDQLIQNGGMYAHLYESHFRSPRIVLAPGGA